MSDTEFEQESTAVDQWETLEIQNRPRWPKVVGIISIVWGSLGLVCGGLGLVATPFMPKILAASLEDGQPVPYGLVPTATDYAIGGLSLGLAVLLLFAGIACVSYRPVTRAMHLLYAGVSIPAVVWGYMNQMHKAELNAQWAREFPDSPMASGFDQSSAGAGMMGQVFGLALLIVLGMGFPLFYLIWFGLIKTKPEQVTGGDEGVY